MAEGPDKASVPGKELVIDRVLVAGTASAEERTAAAEERTAVEGERTAVEGERTAAEERTEVAVEHIAAAERIEEQEADTEQAPGSKAAPLGWEPERPQVAG